jgi:hypothetical protein
MPYADHLPSRNHLEELPGGEYPAREMEARFTAIALEDI